MQISKEVYKNYVSVLEEELIPALGCTEPIAIAYAAAKCREILGVMPKKIKAICSGNIIKNVKGVIVPMSDNMRGVETAAILGCIGGNLNKELEVLTEVTAEHISKTKDFLKKKICTVAISKSKANLHILIEMENDEESASVEIMHTHIGIVKIVKNGKILFELPYNESLEKKNVVDRTLLNISDILEFANSVKIEDIERVISRQIEYNSAIAEEGINNIYGANIGSTLLDTYGEDVEIKAKAKAAAGSDARMSGCVLPVVINSGSGNQGMTVSIPVIEYWKELGLKKEMLYRALCLSNLIAIHQKTKIGRLSAYCGAVSAATGAGAGITYLYGGGEKEICSTITNTLGNVSGIICDGAKPSCAAKISSSVDAAILAHNMTMRKNRFNPNEGIIKDNIEKTINCVSKVARDGMRITDDEILKIMTDNMD